MRKILILSVIFCFLVAFSGIGALNAEASKAGGEKKADAKKAGKVFLCGHCGEMKGGEKCCKADAKKCSKCGLNKGAPGCCKMEKGKDAQLCSKCGEIKGTEKCCKADAKRCGCGMIKGSPGCCKMPKKESKKA